MYVRPSVRHYIYCSNGCLADSIAYPLPLFSLLQNPDAILHFFMSSLSSSRLFLLCSIIRSIPSLLIHSLFFLGNPSPYFSSSLPVLLSSSRPSIRYFGCWQRESEIWTDGWTNWIISTDSAASASVSAAATSTDEWCKSLFLAGKQRKTGWCISTEAISFLVRGWELGHTGIMKCVAFCFCSPMYPRVPRGWRKEVVRWLDAAIAEAGTETFHPSTFVSLNALHRFLCGVIELNFFLKLWNVYFFEIGGRKL